jgi:hypothetical protein
MTRSDAPRAAGPQPAEHHAGRCGLVSAAGAGNWRVCACQDPRRSCAPLHKAIRETRDEAALIVVGESRVQEQLDKVLTRVEKSIEKDVDADSEELERARGDRERSDTEESRRESEHGSDTVRFADSSRLQGPGLRQGDPTFDTGQYGSPSAASGSPDDGVRIASANALGAQPAGTAVGPRPRCSCAGSLSIAGRRLPAAARYHAA